LRVKRLLSSGRLPSIPQLCRCRSGNTKVKTQSRSLALFRVKTSSPPPSCRPSAGGMASSRVNGVEIEVTSKRYGAMVPSGYRVHLSGWTGSFLFLSARRRDREIVTTRRQDGGYNFE